VLGVPQIEGVLHVEHRSAGLGAPDAEIILVVLDGETSET
jgi:hypothetical protein